VAHSRSEQSESRAVRALCAVSAGVSCLALVAIAVLMVVETLLRHFAGHPLGWNVSVVNVLMKVVVFGGLAYTVQARAHVATDLVFRRLNARLRQGLTLLSHLIVLSTAALLSWAGARTVYDSRLHGDLVPSGGFEPVVPTWILELSVPVGSLLLLVIAVHRLVRFLRAPAEMTDAEATGGAVAEAAVADAAVADGATAEAGRPVLGVRS
jgi:C4-dicarboxylate transporter DctQ subunit